MGKGTYKDMNHIYESYRKILIIKTLVVTTLMVRGSKTFSIVSIKHCTVSACIIIFMYDNYVA